MALEFDLLSESLSYVKRLVDIGPKLGIVCGSGLGTLADILERPISIPYSKIPHLRPTTVEGHAGNLVFGYIQKDTPVVCMQGRVHLYEGYSSIECTRPIRLMGLLGIKIMLVTNAAGNLNTNTLKAGQLMVIKDHISMATMAGDNPLRMAYDPRLGERFVSMINCYDTKLRRMFAQSSKASLGSEFQEGVYAMVAGPNFESLAEGRLLRQVGADAVGMSTTLEVLVARQMGIRCVGVSLLANDVATQYNEHDELDDDDLTHEQVLEMGANKCRELANVIGSFINELNSTNSWR